MCMLFYHSRILEGLIGAYQNSLLSKITCQNESLEKDSRTSQYMEDPKNQHDSWDRPVRFGIDQKQPVDGDRGRKTMSGVRAMNNDSE